MNSHLEGDIPNKHEELPKSIKEEPFFDDVLSKAVENITTQAKVVMEDTLLDLGDEVEGITDEALELLESGKIGAFERIIEKEAVPLIDLLKPDDVSLEDYTEEMLGNLFADIERLHASQGRLFVPPEELALEAKNLILSRVRTFVNEHRYTRNLNEDKKALYRKCKLVLLKERDPQDFFNNDPDSYDANFLSSYLTTEYSSRRLTKNDIEDLIKIGYLRNIAADGRTYYLERSVEVVPEKLFEYLLKLRPDDHSLVRTIFDKLSDPEGYSYSKIGETVIANGYSRHIFDNIEKFREMTPEELVNDYVVLNKWTDNRDIKKLSEMLSKLNATPEQKKAAIQKLMSTNLISDRSFESFPQDIQREFATHATIFKELYFESYNNQRPSEEKIQKAEAYIEAGYLNVITSSFYINHFAQTKYEWLLQIAEKYDQVRVLLEMEVLRKEDQTRYAQKLISEGKAYLLKAILERTGLDSHSVFSDRVFDQKIYDSLKQFGPVTQLECFHGLSDEVFTELKESDSYYVQAAGLFRTIDSFAFKRPEFEDYKRYKEVKDVFLEAFEEGNTRFNEDIYFSLNLRFGDVKERGFETVKEEIKRKAILLKNLLAVVFPNEEFRSYYRFSGLKEFLSKSEEEMQKCIEYASSLPAFNGPIEVVITEIVKSSNPEREFKIFNKLFTITKSAYIAIQHFNVVKQYEVDIEKLDVVLELFNRIYSSISVEVQKIHEPLIKLLVQHENPFAKFEQIEDIFIRNALPLVAKKHLIFQLLYRKEDGYKTGAKSPMIQEYKEKERVVEFLTYTDLLRASIESNSHELVEYLTILKDAEALITRSEGGTSLSEEEHKQLQDLYTKLSRIIGLVHTGSEIASDAAIIEQFKTRLTIKEGQTISDRIIEMFLRPLGISSLEELLDYSKRKIFEANNRNRVAAIENPNQVFAEQGDLIKSFKSDVARFVFDQGFVSNEFLGAEAGSDRTPLDIDLWRINEASDLQQTIDHTTPYGDVAALIKPKDRFVETALTHSSGLDYSKPELFVSGVQDKDNHMGIRSAVGITYVDAFIQHKPDRNVTKNLAVESTKKALYIPVYDREGNLLYTPELFDQLRNEFKGTRWSEDPFEVDSSIASKKLVEDDFRLQEGLREVESLRQDVQSSLSLWLRSQGIEFSSRFDARDLTKAEIDDIGSTGRGTSLPDNFDFDFSLRLKKSDFDRSDTFISEILAQAKVEKKEQHTNFGSIQLRLFGATELFGKKFAAPFDLDINFKQKQSSPEYESHDAVADRLASIESHYGPDIAHIVRTEIINAKKILKEAKVYKKGGNGEGGLGGIGVENWILSKGKGSFREACRSFSQASRDENGTERSFADFKAHYMILDPGINVIFNSHDDFLNNLTQEGYKKMVEVVEKYA